MEKIKCFYCNTKVDKTCISQCDFCCINICDACESLCLIYYSEGFDKCLECEKDV